MPTKIELVVGELRLSGELNDSPTSAVLVARLPLSVQMARWGEEYYGDVGKPVEVPPAPDARDVMEIGELAFWIPGNALCLFFGPTPASQGEEPRAASPVNPVGRVQGDLDTLRRLGRSITARIDRA